MNSAWQVEPQPHNLPMKLSWNERRKMARYQKQVQKNDRKRVKAEERERRREEKVWEKQWRDYYKAQEKETKKWRKATSHHPELNCSPATASSALASSSPHEATFPFDPQYQHHHAFHLHSPHNISHPHAHSTTGNPTRPLPPMLIPPDGGGTYSAQYLPLLPSLAAFGVLPASGGEGGARAERSPVVVSR